MEQQIQFSIIVPTYNRQDFIGKTIQSILAQTYTDFEVLVVDDGSKDNTQQVVEAIDDARVHYFKKENGERGTARNYGIKRAKGRYITFIDSDDLMYPFHFEEAMNVIKKHGDPEGFHLAYEYKDTDGRVLDVKLHQPDVNTQLITGNAFSCIGVFVKNEILQEVNFSENRKLSGTEDWLLWLRLSARITFHYSNRVTASMINHESRSVLNYDEQEMLTRTSLLMEGLRADEVFMQRLGHKLPRIEAHMLSYIALHLLLSKKKGRALQYLRRAAQLSLEELFTRRTLAIAKLTLLG